MCSLDTVLAHLKNNELFVDMDDKLLRGIASQATWQELNAGEVLFRKGDVADAMYLVVAPGLIVSFSDKDGKERTASVTPGETVGEMQFITGGRRSAEIRAVQATPVIRLSRSLLQNLGRQREPFLEKIEQTVHRRLLFNELMVILPSLFGELGKEEIIAIMGQSELVRIPRGEMLFEQGDEADGFYILMTGYMALEKRLDGGETVVGNYLRRGEIIGEMALLEEAGQNRRAAGIRAMRDSELFKFSTERFYQFLKQYPSLLLQISRILARRLRKPEQVRINRQSNNQLIAILCSRPDLPVSQFCARLRKAFTGYSSALRIDSDLLDQLLGTPGVSQISDRSSNRIRVSSWFHTQEQSYDFILMQADAGLTPWSRRCVRLADHVIILAPGDEQDRGLSELERHVFFGEHADNHARPCVSLVLLYPDGDTLPQGTREWFGSRRLTNHFHVRWDREQDIERVARYLSGRSTGLVLSGGGARGFAHIGAIRALLERGLPIDIIGGTSMGSVIGAEFALGWDVERITGETSDSVDNLLYDYTLPLTSLFAGRRMVRGLKQMFGQVQIEDLWLPFFCVSSNLTRARQVVHRDGALWLALQASNAAPGILPPVVLDGDLHVDGALLNNLPADVMDAHCNGRVIAVDVSPAVDLKEIPSYGEGLSGWRILWHKLNPLLTPVAMPDIRAILRRSGELASISNRKKLLEEHADIYLKLPVEHFQPEDYKLVRDIVRAGYEYTREQVRAILDGP